MFEQRQKLKIALIQLRLSTDPMGEHEYSCFLKRTGLPRERLIACNAAIERPSLSLLSQVDLLMVGGSGDFSVTDEEKNIPWYPPIAELIISAIDRGMPFFGSCMGIQILAKALGGEVIMDRANQEMGTFPLRLTEEGSADPLFSKLSSPFLAHLGHNCRVSRLPEGMIALVSSDRCPVQAMRLEGKLVYATQFHPELEYEDMVLRIRQYHRNYHIDGDEGGNILLSLLKKEAQPLMIIENFLKMALA